MTENIADTYEISTDKSKLDIPFIYEYLSVESYWAKNIPLDVVKRSIAGSFCFGVYQDEKQVGFARVVTDHATFGYLADVFISEEHRGKGLSKKLMKIVMEHPQLQNLRNWMLATKDAHALYLQFGFKPLESPERFMNYKPFKAYSVMNESQENK
jgi:GNAT superfamily N-acetyltransferase